MRIQGGDCKKCSGDEHCPKGAETKHRCIENGDCSRCAVYGECLVPEKMPKADGGHEAVRFANGGMKYATGKLRLNLVPREGIRQVAKVMEKALEKYEEGSWVNVPVEFYREAIHRHLLEYLDDPAGMDKDSGQPHYAHLAANAMILCHLEKAQLDKQQQNEDIEERR